MDFTFSDDQLLLQKTVRDFLAGECPVDRVRALWESETGRDPELWRELAQVGVPGMLVAEARGGLGFDEIDLALVLEECGRAALAEPVVANAAVGAPLLAELGGAWAEEWLPRLASGAARVAIGHPVSPFVADAHVADLLLLARGDALHALPRAAVALRAQPANDRAQRLFTLEWSPTWESRVAEGTRGRALLDAALDRGALACAAELLGVADRLLELAVRYASQRVQFGVRIGSFQAVKHQLADCAVKLEYARSSVWRAAHSTARSARCRAVDVSMAKVLASEAAAACARTSLQVHGAIGYTWEQDLHVWMRRAWSLDLAWGERAFHAARVAAGVIDGALAAESFGYSGPAA